MTTPILKHFDCMSFTFTIAFAQNKNKKVGGGEERRVYSLSLMATGVCGVLKWRRDIFCDGGNSR